MAATMTLIAAIVWPAVVLYQGGLRVRAAGGRGAIAGRR